jgi:hypothetical protein
MFASSFFDLPEYIAELKMQPILGQTNEKKISIQTMLFIADQRSKQGMRKSVF